MNIIEFRMYKRKYLFSFFLLGSEHERTAHIFLRVLICKINISYNKILSIHLLFDIEIENIRGALGSLEISKQF